MLALSDYLFYIFGGISVLGALGVLNFKNPIYAALSLIMTMVSIAGLFVGLDAYFIAGVQVAVYAGAVMVLFVMVIMLFDLKKEDVAFSGSTFSIGIKIAVSGLLCGLIVWAALYSTDSLSKPAIASADALDPMMVSKTVASLLYSKYVFGFEIISVLLLVVVVGAIALARRERGGGRDV